MASLLSTLGLPGQILDGLIGSHLFGHAAHKAQPSLFHASSFGTMLGSAVNATTAGTDPLAQLTSLVKNGTPISTVVDRLASQITDAVHARLPAAQLQSGASRTQLLNSIKAALSPPSKAPPGTTAAQEAAALERRLSEWLNGVARGANQQAAAAGQQSDTSGQILDAKAAKEIPAQQIPGTPSSTTLDTTALAQSLLASVASSLTTQSGSPATGTLQADSPLLSSAPASAKSIASAVSSAAKESVSRLSTLARLETSLASQQNPDALVSAALSAPSAPSASSAAVTIASTTGKAAPPSGNAGSQAPGPVQAPSGADRPVTPAPADLLARMLVRAAGVDMRLNANANVATPSPATAQAATPGTVQVAQAGTQQGNGAPSAASQANRLTTMLTQAVASAGRPSPNDGSSDNGGTPARDDGSNAAASALLAAAPKAAPASDSGAPAFAVTAASSGPSVIGSSHQAAASGSNPTPVDPNAVIEQVVKSMAMRTQSDGTSEVRLRLVPDQLGSVTMKLTVSGTSVSATAVAQNADVRSALMANQHQLVRSLADSGLKLTSFTVDLSGGHAGNERNQDRTAGFGRHFSVHEVAGAAPSDSTESASPGPSILPSSMLGLFNYLA